MQNINNKNLFLFKDSSEFIIVPNSLEHAYIAILNGELDVSKLIFAKIDSPRGKWGNCLSQILEGKLMDLPSFFQIRNFLEIDLDFLIKNNKEDYVQYLLGSSEILVNINFETYKYISRVLLANNYSDLAIEYAERAKDALYNDIELHFMLAKHYLDNNDVLIAQYYLNECLKLAPNYHPVRKLIDKINNFN